MITLALIGLGKWGKNYLHTVTSFKQAKIKYICAQSQQTLNLFPDTYIKTSSINQLLNHKEIDAFIIATPATTHFDIAKQLLTSGKNILVEKPLTVNYNQALELQRIWQIKKPLVLVGHIYLYNPAYLEFKKLFKRIKKVKSICFEGLNSPVRKDVSVIWDWGPHPVSLLLDLIKLPIIKVSAGGFIKNPVGKLYDTVKSEIIFANNINVSIYISWFGSKKTRKLTVRGESETIEFDDTNTSNRKISLLKHNTLPQYPKYRPEEALTKELIEFIDAIKGIQQITSDMNMGANVVKVLSAIEQSVEKNGQPILLG